jgi:F0F1-type ATP synthase assembly protein I
VPVTRENTQRLLLTARKTADYNGALVASPPERRDNDDAWAGYGTAWSIIGTLLAGPAVWGAIGFGLDRLLGFHALFLSIGLVVGAVGGVYLVVIRYGRSKD